MAQKKAKSSRSRSPRYTPRKDKVAFAKQMRRNPSPPEAILWRCMKAVDWKGIRWTRQKIIRGYIADFAAPRIKLIVEVDGKQHETPQAIAYDMHRDAVIRADGWRIFRVRARDVFARPWPVVGSIKSLVEALGGVSLAREG